MKYLHLVFLLLTQPATYIPLADGSVEAGLESNVETEHYYFASINQVYTLFLPVPSLSATGFAVTVTEQFARKVSSAGLARRCLVSISAIEVARLQCMFSSHWNPNN
ncbi:hypothetical protein DPMN_015369 [Dreissena polymorpha]|uniref:Uncharacterized protein n=1 Tax=Dreissena polymorpha TaxID=45954 RepID=A0A9D4NAX5_DREPO|nr:hypothetical protein DPMN_015369 [Dreissena polymorpha]